MRTRQNTIAMVCACALVTVTATPSVCTGEIYKMKEGIYVGGSVLYNWMSGDFDDIGLLTEDEGSDICITPEVDDGPGFGVAVGWRRFSDAIELSYQHSVHDVDTSIFNIGDDDASYNSIDINYKLDVFQDLSYFAQRQMRPYVLIGLAIPWLTLDDVYWNGHALHDETFWGLGLNLGMGVNYYFDPQWALTGGLTYRWNWFSELGEKYIDDCLEEETLSVTMGISYTF